MEIGKRLFESLDGITCEIPIKFQTLNGYVGLCRANKYAAANYKKQIEQQIRPHIFDLPEFDKVSIVFMWVEENQRRDPDNITIGQKFILDALVANKKLKNDSQRYVKGLFHAYDNGEKTKVILKIVEEE